MTNFKSILCVGLFLGAVATAQAAVDVTIAARGAKVPDNADANVRITTAGSGSNNTLAKSHTSVLSLKQEATTASTLRILNGELFSVDLLSILSGKAALTIGNTVGVGTVESLTGPLSLVNASTSLLTFNADVSVPTNVITKTGTGSVAVRGAMVGDIDQQAGKMTYYASDAYAGSSLTVSGDGSLYGVATRYADRARLKDDFSLPGGVKAIESVLTTSGEYPLNELQVNGGNVVRLRACNFRQLEMTEDDTYWYDQVPDCILVGSNSVGVLNVDGGTLYGKLAIAAGSAANAKGVVFIGGRASVRNYCPVVSEDDEGEFIFGRSGYAYLEVAGGATNTMYGFWMAGRGGQFNLVVTNGVFSHSPASVRPSGFRLGGENGNSALYVGPGGRFDATGASCGVGLAYKASATVADGGVLDVGMNDLEVRDDAVLNVNAGGVFRGAGVKADGNATVQFDGGTWQMPDGADFDSKVFVSAGGITIDVPSGTAKITGEESFLYPEGRGVKSISGVDGTVFLGPPSVDIVGDGYGATALCDWNRASGKVTGIRVTGSGFDYSSATASLRYGGSAAGSPLKLTLGDVTAGEIVKTGAGTLEVRGMTNCLRQAIVREGTLKIGVIGAVSRDSSICVEADGTLDLGGFGTNDVMFSGYYNAGHGKLDNGMLTLAGLVCDFHLQTNRVCVLDMNHICFTDTATIRIPNVPADLNRGRSYDLYRLVGDNIESVKAFPRVDSSVSSVISKAWGVVLEPRVDEDGNAYKMAVLRYIGGSLFIYY